jgi:hypothetical protein
MAVEPIASGAIDFAAVDNGVWTVHVFSAKGLFFCQRNMRNMRKKAVFI